MIRIGVDFGGTKIEAAALDDGGEYLARIRRPNPGEYQAALATVRELVEAVEAEVGTRFERVGLGIPGSLSPSTGTVRNANSTWLNGRTFQQDLAAGLGRQVRIENDANCLALSEAVDGAGAGAEVVFAVIIGTGVGGGLVAHGRPIGGRNGIGGEWGHTPLPWQRDDEHPGPLCWCGRRGCMEQWVSGPAFAARSAEAKPSLGGRAAPEIVAAAQAGDADAQAAVDLLVDRLARGLAVVADVCDPDAFVLGGGLSNLELLYERLPEAVSGYVLSDTFTTPIRRAKWGDSSGVRGAAWLWP